ncbi:hypothetical protein KIL84_004059 [Mauremys mutica]|uniref:Uncharacterized protein n=1 Tax=Mauremys mutica TaxID=74926 RepID=A0A9D3XMU5_9SAUR|nr:hypothetical protein KIL84_004059 [Mauremys mutica]
MYLICWYYTLQQFDCHTMRWPGSLFHTSQIFLHTSRRWQGRWLSQFLFQVVFFTFCSHLCGVKQSHSVLMLDDTTQQLQQKETPLYIFMGPLAPIGICQKLLRFSAHA